MVCEEMARKYCNGDITFIANYQLAIADKAETWDIHHRLETENSDGEKRVVCLSQKELKALGVYFNRPPEELIFMRQAEHKYMHKKGKPLSEDHRKRISIANRLNVTTRCNAEMRKKLLEIAKARTEKYFLGHHHTKETKKILSENHKGICKNKHWFNDGKIEIMDYTKPEGFYNGRLFHERKIRNKRSVK